MRILIAEDDATSRLVLTGVLQKFGHEVIATVDGTEAWEAMQRPDAPALAILDWMMPGLDGVEVIQRIRGLGSDDPPYLILLTSMRETADVVAGLDAGADDYLAKPFDPGELRARVGVGCRVIELQVRLREAHDALAIEATHDPLTGALNRRAFADLLSSAISDGGRDRPGLSLGICDIDEFKKVNDVYGHQVGDEVLCWLVQQLAGSLGPADVLSRHGGDEFVVLAEHDGEDDVRQRYERARAAIGDRPIPTTAGALPITISIGVSVWTEGDSVDDLFRTADAALYRAKNAGRNRVAVAED